LALKISTLNPKLASNVGILKALIDCLLDPNLKNIQVRQDFIIVTLLILISDPKTRVYFRS